MRSIFALKVMMKQKNTYLFAVVGGCLLTIGRGNFPSLPYQASLTLSWCGLFAALQSVQDKNKRLAGVCIALSLLLSGFWFFHADTSRQIVWITVWLTGLLIVWPLRFIALGEIASALLGAAFFWHIGIPASLPFYILTALLLSAASFHDNRALYTQQKAVQHYSLPVLLGSLIPALDRRWQAPPRPLLPRLLPPLYWLTVTGFLYL